MTEIVSNETIAPLKYIMQFGKALLQTVKQGEEIANKIMLILSIAKVLEAKTIIFRDQRLLTKKTFETSTKLKGFNHFMNKIIKSMTQQAAVKQI